MGLPPSVLRASVPGWQSPPCGLGPCYKRRPVWRVRVVVVEVCLYHSFPHSSRGGPTAASFQDTRRCHGERDMGEAQRARRDFRETQPAVHPGRSEQITFSFCSQGILPVLEPQQVTQKHGFLSLLEPPAGELRPAKRQTTGCFPVEPKNHSKVQGVSKCASKPSTVHRR